jgi:iron complex outermembrane receptor protein
MGGVALTSEAWDLRGEVEHVTHQHRIAANETVTPAYTLVNLEFGGPGASSARCLLRWG